jgi:hypothetical protein
VVAIVGGTYIRDDRDAEKLIGDYARSRHSPWAASPERAREIFMKLWADGKIIQPRSMGLAPIMVGGGSHWAVQLDNVGMVKVIKLIGQMEESDYGKTNQGS